MVNEKSSMLKNIFNQFVQDEDSVHDYWAQLVLKYDRENNTAKLYIPAYTGVDGCVHLLHPLIQTYTTLKAAFDKDKKIKEAFNLENPSKVFDLVSNCSYATVNQKIPENELHNFLTDIKDFFNFPEQKYLGEIGDFSYYWLGRYVALSDWVDQDNRWNAFEFEKALTAYMQDFIKHYCEHGYKQVNNMQPTVHSLRLWMAESIAFNVNDSFSIVIPFLDPRVENSSGLFGDFVATAITIRVFFQLSTHLKEYINVDANMLVDSVIYGPSPDDIYNKRNNDLIDIARNSSLDLVSFLEQWSAYIDTLPDFLHENPLEYTAYLKHAFQNPTAIERNVK